MIRFTNVDGEDFSFESDGIVQARLRDIILATVSNTEDPCVPMAWELQVEIEGSQYLFQKYIAEAYCALYTLESFI